ncbi:MAG: TRAP transporter large permease subunit, partial [Desulfatiglandales bacterium]|nr:TRAP transporter large permease subunit [Desulfatiglandales bacterium]
MVDTLMVFGLFFLLLLIGMPIAFTFFISGFVGIVLFRGIEPGVSLSGMSPFTESSNYILLAIPLFILLGQFVFYSGLSKELYYTTYRWLGRLRGGLAHATVVTCALFAACTGSSMASVGAIAPIAMSEMERYK